MREMCVVKQQQLSNHGVGHWCAPVTLHHSHQRIFKTQSPRPSHTGSDSCNLGRIQDFAFLSKLYWWTTFALRNSGFQSFNFYNSLFHGSSIF